MPLPAAGTMKTNSQMLLLIHIRPSRYGFSVPAQTQETLLRHRSFLIPIPASTSHSSSSSLSQSSNQDTRLRIHACMIAFRSSSRKHTQT